MAAVVSPDKGMLMVETMAPKQKGKVDTGASGVIVTDPRPVVMIDFYRLSGGDAPGAPLDADRRGSGEGADAADAADGCAMATCGRAMRSMDSGR